MHAKEAEERVSFVIANETFQNKWLMGRMNDAICTRTYTREAGAIMTIMLLGVL